MTIERAVAFRISRDFVEQQRRRGAMAVLGEHMGDGAHLGVPAGAIDADEFAYFLDLVDPAAQAAIAAAHQFQTSFARLGHPIPPQTVPKLEIRLILVWSLSQSREPKCYRNPAQIIPREGPDVT